MPTSSWLRPFPTPPTPPSATLANRPPQPTPKTQRVPLATWPAFEAAHRAGDQRLKVYLERGYKNYLKLPHSVRAELDPRNAKFLYANNADARRSFAKIAYGRFSEFADEKSGTLFHWITL